ncbi:MAG: arginine deiminase family protein [Bacillus sp. (in: firmicutes)]
MNITIYNEYDPLEKVIIGSAESLYFPDAHEIEQEEGMPAWKQFLTNYVYRMLKGKKVPELIKRQFKKELYSLKKLLEDHGVEVLTVDPIIPKTEDAPGIGQMFARDSVISLGNQLIEGNLQIEMRKKELLGYQKIIDMVSNNNDILSVPTKEDIFLEGGDVIIDKPYIFVGVGKYASNLAGVEWLRSHLDNSWHVVPIQLSNDAILHLDCCMTIVGPKKAIIHRESLQQPLPKELSDYKFIEIDGKTRKQMGSNVLVIGPNKVIVQKRHRKLQKSLKQAGFTVLPLSFTWHALLDGAFRCASCPLSRTRK